MTLKKKKPYRKPQVRTTYDEKSLCVRFDSTTWETLQRHARALNVSPSAFVRVAVAAFGEGR